ncbi:hypothetical protein ACIG5F_48460, partial [Kutzneria sp. NPDC052558]
VGSVARTIVPSQRASVCLGHGHTIKIFGGSRRNVRSSSAASHLIDTVADIDPRWLDGVDTIGLTSGASVPETLVTQVISSLAGRG